MLDETKMTSEITSESALQPLHVSVAGHRSLGDAISAWTNVLGSDAVESTLAGLAKFKSSTIGVSREVPVVLRPANTSEIVDIVKIANRFRVHLYPVSTGRNWGYGDSSPVTNGCVVVDLSRMNQIIEFQDLSTYGVATIQPGVTQQSLHDFLTANSLPYMTPTHGGGPECSILGNALERGYGITPITNHFEAVTSLTAVLGNGTVHNSLFESIGAPAIGDRRKSQVGPDIDGLFAQSNFGIVTQAKVRLPRRPKHVAAFFFRLRSNEDMANLASQIREVLFEFHPKTVGAINVMNSLRVLAMIAPYPIDKVGPGSTIGMEHLHRLATSHDIPPWLGVGSLFGSSRSSIQRAFRSIKKRFGKVAFRVIWLDECRVNRTDVALRLLPSVVSKKYRPLLESIRSFLKVAAGEPSRVALPLVYWRSGKRLDSNQALNPQKDGCGIIWYAPYVAIERQRVDSFREMVEVTCRRFGIEPLITFTTVDDQTFDATIPILFDRGNPEAVSRAKACYETLFQEGVKIGAVPYRFGIGQMQSLIDLAPNYWKNVKSLRDAFDPNGIIAPSRYCP